MQDLESKKKFFPIPGATIGQITVVQYVQDLYHHPLLHDTPKGYIRQGNLWECSCTCGKNFLISDVILSRGQSKSCGCKRRAKREVNWQERSKEMERKIEKMKVESQIKLLRYELESIKIIINKTPELEARQEEVAAQLRAAHAKKASLAAQYHKNGNRKRKIINPEKIERLGRLGIFTPGRLEELREQSKKARQDLGFPE